MDSAHLELSESASEEAPASCSWSCLPLREEPVLKTLALGLTITVSAAVMAVSLGDPIYGAISLVVLVLATMGYFLPTVYVINSDGAARKQLVWRRRPWTSFRRVVRHRDGVFLSPFRRRHRLDSFRGVFLRFGSDVDGDVIDSMARSYVER